MARTTKTRKTPTPKRDVAQEIADRVLQALAEGCAPWRKPWKGTSAPHNPASGTRYRGINIWLTLMTMWDRGYNSPVFLSLKQAGEVAAKAWKAKGVKVERGQGRWAKNWFFVDGPNAGEMVRGVRQGQSQANGCGGTTVVLWKPWSKEVEVDGVRKEESGVVLRTYTVFNLEQCEDIVQEYFRERETIREFAPIERCEDIVNGFEVKTVHGGASAHYTPSQDTITLPPKNSFESDEEYYGTRFHEMAHATGHPSRLGRKGVRPGMWKPVHTYAEEELIAEMASAILASEAGIDAVTHDNSVAYLRGWASKIQEDPRVVLRAAQAAQKAADLILGAQVAEQAEAA